MVITGTRFFRDPVSKSQAIIGSFIIESLHLKLIQEMDSRGLAVPLLGFRLTDASARNMIDPTYFTIKVKKVFFISLLQFEGKLGGSQRF